MASAAAATDTTVEVVTRFESGFNTRDIDAIMADMTDDSVFEHVAPEAVSFGRHEGQAAVRVLWGILRWRQADRTEGLIRGVDVFRLRDGKIAEQLMYATA